jgi:putative cardiolipin synthase
LSKLPDRSLVEASTKIVDLSRSGLARSVVELTQNHLGESGVYPLASGRDALSARLAMIAAADLSLDLQYYIWHRDHSGQLLVSYLMAAAERGVRVRLLLDDFGSPVGDDRLLLLSQHPNVEVRLFNPLVNRVTRLWGLLWNYSRASRRMHNKSLTVDNAMTLVGGRNIGDEYFDSGAQVDFADLDILAIGPVVDEVSDGFDEFWNSDFSYPIQLLSKKRFTARELMAAADTNRNYRDQYPPDERTCFFLSLRDVDVDEHLSWYWSRAQVFYDHPDKIISVDGDTQHTLGAQLVDVSNSISQELLLVSPYFVPGKRGLKYFRQLRNRGVNITIITNSLAATDVGAVHSAYAKYRKRLLKMGVVLYEARPDMATARRKAEQKIERRKRRWAFKRKVRSGKSGYVGSSSRASLHAKAFFIDRQRTFVGSMNLDPRSILINTEIGVLVDNPVMTCEAIDDITHELMDHAFEVRLDKRKKLIWVLQEEGEEVTFHSEPLASIWQRLGAWLMGLLPLESQL